MSIALPVLPTKLYAPPLLAQLLPRPSLIAKLTATAPRPLTLIAAPAGFGKTTLAVQWLAHGERPAAWLSLEEDDNELGRFLTYLLAALRTIGPANLGEPVLALLHAPHSPPLRALLHALAHALIADLPSCVLVLDDYHLISAQPIHETVLFLLEHVPALHWVINTRADPPLPLGRLRARQQLLELRAADLRFHEDETAQLLNVVLHFALPTAAVRELHAKTEGWIAGLQLAGLAMQNSPAPSEFIRDFYGSHRYVADYLADEVLRHLPDQQQAFLLQSSILERMCAELCEAVCDVAQAQSLLEELEAANLFLMGLDDHRRWYRYHQLFADLLRQRLQRRQPELVAVLHQRAAAWFVHHDLVDDALRHLLVAKAFVQAADLLEQRQEQLWTQGRFGMLRHWLALLPPDLIATRPRLLLAQAWTHVLTDAPASTIATLFQQAEAALAQCVADDAAELAGIFAAIRAVYASKEEASNAVIANAERALACLPENLGRWRSIALMALGFAYEMTGAVRAAEQAFTEAIALCYASGNPYSALVSTMRLARTYLVQGQLRHAAATYQAGLTEALQRGMAQLPNTAQAYINLGRLHYEWNDLAAAAAQLQQGLALLQEHGGSWLQFEGYVLLARTNQRLGELAAASALLDQAAAIAPTIPFQWTKGATVTTLLRARLALGQLAGTAQWLAQVEPTLGAELNRLSESDHVTAARILIAQGRSAAALPLLIHLIQAAESAGRVKAVVENCVLAALSYQQQGEPQPAQIMLHKALVLAEPEGYMRTFVDEGEPIYQLLTALVTSLPTSPLLAYAKHILAAFADGEGLSAVDQASPAVRVEPPAKAEQPLIEPLSARELELLQLMAAGLSNQEIADRLIITLGTVKSHANHIFGKLGVQGRVKAINRARELALIEDY